MNQLDHLYAELLSFGMLSIREAVRSKDLDWAEAEVEFLHNVPSLQGEANLKRHRYFWDVERQQYLDWVNASGRVEIQRQLRMFYEPIFEQMRPLVLPTAVKQNVRKLSSTGFGFISTQKADDLFFSARELMAKEAEDDARKAQHE